MSFAPIYFTIDDVKNWIYTKVTFGNNITNSITDDFLSDLCAEAEAEVLNDLNWFYEVPLASKLTNDYPGLPATTRAFLKRLFLAKSVELLLQVDFGRNSNVKGDNYIDNVGKLYGKTLAKITSKDPKTGQFRYSPLPGLRINTSNWTGLKIVPRPLTTGKPCGLRDNMRYAISQVTTPAQAWWSFGDGRGDVCGCGTTPCCCD